MIHLGGQAATPKKGYARAKAALADGSALKHFFQMVKAQGGEISAFDDPIGFHNPGATEVVAGVGARLCGDYGYDRAGLGRAETGAGRDKAGEPVDPDAGIVFHARRGAYVEKGQPLATVYATEEEKLAEPVEILKHAIQFAKIPPEAVDLVDRRRAANSLKKTEIKRLYIAIREVITAGIKYGGASVVTYFHPDGSVGTAHQHFNVAHNQKKVCAVCGGPIERIVVRGRGTYYCPRCQK